MVMTARSEAQRARRLREAVEAGRLRLSPRIGEYIEPGRVRCRMSRLGVLVHASACRHFTYDRPRTSRPRGRPRKDRRSEAQRARRLREQGVYPPDKDANFRELKEAYSPDTANIRQIGNGTHERPAETISERENRSLSPHTSGVLRSAEGVCRSCGQIHIDWERPEGTGYCHGYRQRWEHYHPTYEAMTACQVSA